MRERPILFSAPMIHALIAGTKTVTRRIINPQPERVAEHKMVLAEGRGKKRVAADVTVPDGWQWKQLYAADGYGNDFARSLAEHSPFAVDRLWVKETFAAERIGKGRGKNAKARVFYRASCPHDECTLVDGDELGLIKIEKWRPSIFMSRAFSRITLEVVSVRAERLHDITEEDAKAEGVEPLPFERRVYPSSQAATVTVLDHRAAFQLLWESINGAESWRSNPWVWRVEFRRVA